MKKPNTSLVKKTLLIATLPLALAAGNVQAHVDSDILIPILLLSQYQQMDHHYDEPRHHHPYVRYHHPQRRHHHPYVRYHHPQPRHVHNYHYQPHIKHHQHQGPSHGNSHYQPKRLQKENARFK